MAIVHSLIREAAMWPRTDHARHLPGMMTHGLHIPWSIWIAMHRHLVGELPREAVGLLSVRDADAAMVGDQFYPGENADRSRTRYTMSPDDVRIALSDIARRGTRLGAVVHSHPQTPAVPSAGDLAEATLPGVLSVIVGFKDGVEVRVWRLAFDNRGRARTAAEVAVVVGTGMATGDRPHQRGPASVIRCDVP